MRKLNKRAQIDVIAFIGVVVSLLILAPIMLKIVNESLDGFESAINSTSELAATEVDTIHNTFISFWDYLIGIAFLVNMIMLFVFAFLVDSHPIFSLFYLISAIITLMFAHYVVVPIQTIFGMDAFSTEVLQLPITEFLVTRFDLMLLGVIMLTGAIMYGKYRATGGFER